jgi:hypothetical protein
MSERRFVRATPAIPGSPYDRWLAELRPTDH